MQGRIYASSRQLTSTPTAYKRRCDKQLADQLNNKPSNDTGVNPPQFQHFHAQLNKTLAGLALAASLAPAITKSSACHARARLTIARALSHPSRFPS